MEFTQNLGLTQEQLGADLRPATTRTFPEKLYSNDQIVLLKSLALLIAFL